MINCDIDFLISFLKDDSSLPKFSINKEIVELCDEGTFDVFDLIELGIQFWVQKKNIMFVYVFN